MKKGSVMMKTLRRFWESLDRYDAIGGIGITGLVMVSVGAGVIYTPASLLVGGGLLIAFAVWQVKRWAS